LKPWRDTLARRLFVLMWVSLVLSQLLAWGAFAWLHDGPFHVGPMLVMPSLPPILGPGPGPRMPPQGAPARTAQPASVPTRPPGADAGPEAFDDASPPNGPMPQQAGPGRPGGAMPNPPANGPGGTPAPFGSAWLVLDFGLRMAVIALAAWWGSRWLAAPMRALVRAGEQLAARLGRGEQQAPRLPESQGTLEVREAARVFNGMASEIEQLFDERGLMLAALSHDLRTPLTRLRLRLEATEMPDALRDKAAADIAAMNGLIDEVLGLFRGSDGEALREVDVAALVQALADDWLDQGQQLQCAIAAPAVARARSAALRRVVENLVGNALRYGRDVAIEVAVEPTQVCVRVADRGPGIAPELLDQVFQPFYRVEASRSRTSGGTGLGLFIARDLCRRMGARLSLTNREGGGLLAEVRLQR